MFAGEGISMARYAGVAQLVEQLICNQQVAGSSPIASSNGIYSAGHCPADFT